MKYFMAVAASVLLLLNACDISKPRMPQWDVDLSLPLMNERYLVSDLADSLNLIIGEDDILTMTGTGSAETPPFGDVNYTPEIFLESTPLYSGTQIETKLSLHDPTGTVFLSYGEFDEGQINYLFDMDNPANTQITLVLPDIVTPSGDPFTINGNGTSNWQSHSLIDCKIGIEDSGLLMDSLSVSLSITSNQPDGTLLGTASLQINSQIGFRKFQGYLYDYVRALEGTVSTISIDYPLGLESAVQLMQANVYLDVLNETGFAAEFHGEIRAVNNRTGQERTVSVVDDQGNFFQVLPASEEGPVHTEIIFSQHVVELLQILPDEIEIYDSYLLINGGHDGTAGFVKEIDKLYCTYQMNAPLELILYDHTFEMKEPVEVEISQENQDNIQNILAEAMLTVEVTNRIPVGGTANLYVSTQRDIDTTIPVSYDIKREVTIHSSEYSGNDVGEDGSQLLHFSLSEDELSVFANPLVYLLFTFSFEPSDDAVTIYASPADYVQVKSMLSASLHVEVE